MQRATRDERRAFVALRIGSIVLPLIAALVWGLVAYRGGVDATRRHAQESAALVSQYVERLIQTQTILHDAVRLRAAKADDDFLRSREFHEFLRGIEGQNIAMFGIAVMAVDGTLVASSRRYPVTAKMGRRDYLTAIGKGDDRFIDRIRLEPTQADAIVMASALTLRDGGPRLAIVSAVGSDLIADFLRGIATQSGEAASILREDGKLLIRNLPAMPITLPPDSPVRLAIADADSGTLTMTAATDQITRLYAFRRMAGLPLFANFGTPTRLIMADWFSRVLPVWGLLALIGAFTTLSVRRLRLSMTQRFELEAALRRVETAEKLADERIRLMRETNHRVKNNLSLIVSLINMQMRGKTGIDGAELKARIGAISHVHDLMYRAADGVHVDFSETLCEIARSPAIVPHEQGISVICDAERGIVLGPDTTTPLAIIAAELLTNAVKHAFQGRSAGTIHVRLKRRGETGMMEVTDDGVGLPLVTPRRSGAAIIDALVHQIGGEITRDTGGSTGGSTGGATWWSGSTGPAAGEGADGELGLRPRHGLRLRVSFPLPAA